MYFIILIKCVISFTQYEQGLFAKFDFQHYPFYCALGTKAMDTIIFQDSFQIIPQVIIIPVIIDSVSGVGGYDLEILDVNNQNFSIQITCHHQRLYSLRFQWYAIDNTAITVINSFKITNFQNYTIPHSNKLASNGFISIISLRYQGALNFSISISSITTDSVSIEIQNPTNLIGNLLSISYQIILGPSSFIQQISTQVTLNKYTSLLIPKQCNNYFLLSIYGCIFDNLAYMRLQTSYLSEDPIQYTREAWMESQISNIYKEIQLRFTATPAHFKLENLNFLQFKQTQVKQNLLLQVNIEELELQLSTIGSQSFTINPQIYKVINFKIYGQCIQQMNIAATYKKSCNKETLFFNQQCSPDKQQFFIQSKHQIQNTQIENITVILANSSLQINQILYGSTIETVEIIKVEIK